MTHNSIWFDLCGGEHMTWSAIWSGQGLAEHDNKTVCSEGNQFCRFLRTNRKWNPKNCFPLTPKYRAVLVDEKTMTRDKILPILAHHCAVQAVSVPAKHHNLIFIKEVYDSWDRLEGYVCRHHDVCLLHNKLKKAVSTNTQGKEKQHDQYEFRCFNEVKTFPKDLNIGHTTLARPPEIISRIFSFCKLSKWSANLSMPICSQSSSCWAGVIAFVEHSLFLTPCLTLSSSSSQTPGSSPSLEVLICTQKYSGRDLEQQNRCAGMYSKDPKDQAISFCLQCAP